MSVKRFVIIVLIAERGTGGEPAQNIREACLHASHPSGVIPIIGARFARTFVTPVKRM